MVNIVTIQEKICPKCKNPQPLVAFARSKKTKDGKRSWCRNCGSNAFQEYYKANPEYFKEHDRNWRTNNLERRQEIGRKGNHKYYQKNQKILYEKSRLWFSENPGKTKEYRDRSNNKRYDTEKGKLRITISNLIRKSLRGNKNGHHWELLVGYSLDKLKKNIEKQFTVGMSWENYGCWHVDHKIPISVFNFEKPEDIDFKRCWSLKNLQPLWAKENISKGARLAKPFQPSLAMEAR